MLRGLRAIPRGGPCAAERRPRAAERRPRAAERRPRTAKRPLCRKEALCVGRSSVLRGLEEALYVCMYVFTSKVLPLHMTRVIGLFSKPVSNT